MVVLEEAIGNPRPVVDKLRTKAAAHAVHVSAESALDLARVELAHPARHRHAHERDADPGVLTTGQEVLEGAGGAAVEPIVAQPLPRLAEPEQRRGVGSHALRWLAPAGPVGRRRRWRPRVLDAWHGPREPAGRGAVESPRRCDPQIRRRRAGDPREPLATV